MKRDIDLRAIFDSVRQPWRDRGRNCSTGNVNICCPFCGDDQGFHLACSEKLNGAFYCYRRPQDHRGAGLRPILLKLGLERWEAMRLIDANAGRMRLEEAKEAPAEASATTRAWDRFGPADARALRYLALRGFDDPDQVAGRYDLRSAPAGQWAARLLLPMKEGDDCLAWTGRCVRGRDDPKYLTENHGHGGLIYQPRACRDIMVICEGPLDALKVAAASEGMAISALALTGKALNDERLWRIVKASARASRILLCLDADCSLAERSRMLAELRGAFFGRRCDALKLPAGQKDAGALPMENARSWLGSLDQP